MADKKNIREIKPILEMRAFRRELSRNAEPKVFLKTLLLETIAAMDASGGAIYLLSGDDLVWFGKLKQKKITVNFFKNHLKKAIDDDDLSLDTGDELIALLRSGGEIAGCVYVSGRQYENRIGEFTNYDKAIFIATLATASIAIENQSIKEENDFLKKIWGSGDEKKMFIGNSPMMEEVRDQVRKIATFSSDFSVLISGESGTGKEVIANAIYENSRRNKNNFVVLNCSSIPENLLESELFGHKKGAFTGAFTDKEGKISLANNGVLFLDEIGEMNLTLQAKLLRVLENGSYSAVGSNKTEYSNFLLISATNRNLFEEIKEGRFREDLYYRITTFQIFLPPLRERIDDIEDLIRYFLLQLKKKYPEKKVKGLSQETLRQFKTYSWPGNIRELKHCLESVFLMSESRFIEGDVLPGKLVDKRKKPALVFDTVLPLEDAIGQYVHFAYKENENRSRATMEKLKIDHRRLQRYLGNYHDYKFRFPVKENIELDVLKELDRNLENSILSEEKLIKLKRALIEAIINIVEHSAGGKDYFDIFLTVKKFKIKIEIIDYGNGMDTDQISYKKPAPEQDRGWGLHLMKESLDGLSIESNGYGTKVIMMIKPDNRKR